MDLLASYASSDDDDSERGSHHRLHNTTELQPSTSIFSSLPQPKTRSTEDVGHPSSSTATFSALPKPSASSATARRIVQIIAPIPPPSFLDDEEDEEDKERKRLRDSRTTTQAPSVRSFLSSIPMPRHSSILGASASSSGSGRRSILENEAEVAAPIPAVTNPPAVNVENGSNAYMGHEFGSVSGYVEGAAYQENYPVSYDEAGAVGWNGISSDVVCDQGSYGARSEFSVIGDIRKRGRKEKNVEIVEVKQDELMKNRPREDQMKLTGIAFGPTHQPASTNKGKPSKLHKRKHQIGSLYFDMKQKETELQERRARGLLTKSQTQGKYGW